jgi:hypothetical protein
VVNSLQLLTAKPVTYLVNLSEKDFIRKKNKWLPKIKAWIDEHNPGDPLIPFSVALEERLAPMSAEEKAAEEKAIGATSSLGKITNAGYTSLEVCRHDIKNWRCSSSLQHSLFVTSPAVLMRFVRGRSAREPRPHRRPVLFSKYTADSNR